MSAVHSVEEFYQAKVFLFLQTDEDDTEWNAVSPTVYKAIARASLPKEKVIFLIHSLGGSAESAYQVVAALRQKCGSYSSFVPAYAKSAATLLAMGGDPIIMPHLAHLGPIDAQVLDYDLGDRKSALEVVQAVERLRSEAMETLKQSVMTMIAGTRLPFTTLLPHAVELTSGLMRPLLDHVDVGQYMRMSRTMKIGEEYAIRIMEDAYGLNTARSIARHFAQDYPEHAFVILAGEVAETLNVEGVPEELDDALTSLSPYLGNINAIGLIEEIEGKTSATQN